MNPNQQKPNRLEIDPKDLEKVKKWRENQERTKVDENWVFIAEFGYYYGWEGVMAILENKIDFDTANMLVAAANKVWSGKLYDMTKANFIGSVSARSKNPSVTFNKLTKSIIKEATPDKL